MESHLKDYNLQIRLTYAHRVILKSAASMAGLSVSGWARDRMRTAARVELKAAGPDVRQNVAKDT